DETENSISELLNLSLHDALPILSKFAAHWDLIPEIKKLRDEVAPNTLLTINGGIPDRQTGMELVEQNGVDGVMIGRGVFKKSIRSEEHTSELKSRFDLVCRLLLE